MSATFSEHWHRVAKQRLALRPTVQMHRQIFRGERWYVVSDPLTNRFFRITPGAHDLLCRLQRGRTVQAAWEESLERDPDGAPGQEEVIQLLGQLHQANLLRGEVPPEAASLFERHTERRRRERRAQFNLMSFRIPLLDPDRFLRRALPLVRWLFGPIGLVLWLGVVGAALKVALDHAPEFAAQSEGLLAPANLGLLYLGLVLIKVLHEFGHAFACRKLGGEVHEMGVMFLYFSPVPYVDATSSWAFRERGPRIFVAAAGMLIELFVAALAVFVWANTAPGALHSVAYNMIFVASITTLVFNANPLMRYDGYYILSDWLELPNLSARSMEMLRYLAERSLFACRDLENPAATAREGWTLALYGLTSWLYRLIVFAGIAWWISSQWLLLGVVLALLCVWSFAIAPLWKLARYLAASPRLARTRPRAVLVTCGGFALVLALLALWPMPNRFRAPGVLRAEQYSEIFTAAPGTIVEIQAASGIRVEQGQPLVRFTNRTLELEIAAAESTRAQAVAGEERALARATEALGPIRARRIVAEKRLAQLQRQQAALQLTAPHAGTWVSPQLIDSVGRWFPRGERLGEVVRDDRFRFLAVISQDEAAGLFTDRLRGEVRLIGEAGAPLGVSEVQVIPAQQDILPSAALGWAAGGEVATSQHDRSGLKTAESFFELRAMIATPAAAALRHQRSGKIRLELRPEPLLAQWTRKLGQLLQKRAAL
ncbi:MAG: peptidase M50 [Chthoniobacteraceae bacterium]